MDGEIRISMVCAVGIECCRGEKGNHLCAVSVHAQVSSSQSLSHSQRIDEYIPSM